MAITGLKTWVTGDALSAANLNADKAVLEAKFSAGITTADLASAANITNAQLENKHYEIVLNMTVDGVRWAACADGDPVAFAGLPNDVNAIQYDIVGVEWGTFDSTGAMVATETFDIEWGYFNAGAWTIVGGTQINTAGAIPLPNMAANQGTWQTLANPAASVSTVLATPRLFAIQRVASVGAGFTTADQWLTVSIKLKRNLGLRS